MGAVTAVSSLCEIKKTDSETEKMRKSKKFVISVNVIEQCVGLT